MVYFQYVRILLKSLAQYRASLRMLVLGQFVTSFGYFAGLVFLFDRFGSISGWTFAEVALCFAVTGMAFSISECFSRGFDMFQSMIREGSFDRVLLRPVSPVVQVFGSRLEVSRLGRLIQNAVVLVIAIRLIHGWTPPRVLTLALMILSGVFIFTGVFILGSTVCFWTVKGLEFVNIFTDGGREAASYPLPVYGKWMCRFFTFVLPYACFNYLPLQYAAGRTDRPLVMLLPLAGMLFIVPCLAVWYFGIRYYVSTGS